MREGSKGLISEVDALHALPPKLSLEQFETLHQQDRNLQLTISFETEDK